MILILSNEYIDEPTNRVIDWLIYFKANFIRLNGSDFHFKNRVKIDLSKDEINFENYKINARNVSVVWYRRWIAPEKTISYFDKYIDNGYKNDEVVLIEDYNKFLNREFTTYTNSIFSIFRNKKWIPQPSKARGNINKLDVLMRARDCGLKIPKTIVSTNKKEVYDFLHICGSLITKPLNEALTLRYKKEEIPLFTVEVTEKDIDNFPDFFYPSLFQEKIEKEFEIRVFYYREKMYCMAIFSQNDEKTKLDFRNYNRDKPNRNIPFDLPDDVRKNIIKLMKNLDLNTGSLDLIYSINDDYVFLEVNPVGQFSMMSVSCNYPIEKEIAEDLINEDKIFRKNI